MTKHQKLRISKPIWTTAKEAELHARYDAVRVRGEWFRLSAPQVEEVIAILGGEA